jgi:hypothetical protein
MWLLFKREYSMSKLWVTFNEFLNREWLGKFNFRLSTMLALFRENLFWNYLICLSSFWSWILFFIRSINSLFCAVRGCIWVGSLFMFFIIVRSWIYWRFKWFLNDGIGLFFSLTSFSLINWRLLEIFYVIHGETCLFTKFLFEFLNRFMVLILGFTL